MSNKHILVFMVLSVLASVGLAAALFPAAALTQEELERREIPQDMYSLPDINLGADFGTVPVVELVTYYVENPPAPAGASAAPKRRMGGC